MIDATTELEEMDISMILAVTEKLWDTERVEELSRE